MAPAYRLRRHLYTVDHEAFRESVARFVAQEVTPHLEQWREDGALAREVFAAAGSAGFLGTSAPEDVGGGGVDDLGFTATLVEEVTSVGAVALGWALALQAGVATWLLGETDCTRLLSGVVSGETIVAASTGDVTVDESGISGSLASVACAAFADLLLIDLDGADVAVVEIDQSSVTVDRQPPPLAAPELGVADVVLDGARITAVVPKSMRGHLDLWFAVTMRAAAAAAFDLGVAYVSERKVFGQPLGAFENTQLRMAELAADLAVTTAFVDSCVGAGDDCEPDDVAVGRLTAARLLDDVVDQCLQFHGGYGYMREYPISTAFADARFLRLLAQRFSDPRIAITSRLGR